MDYLEAQDYLKSSLAFGIRLGLDRMRRLVSLLGHPERQCRFIHLAGTNGKGSTAAYCAAILASANLRVGIFTSPYLIRLTERIRVIDGRSGLEALFGDESHGEIDSQAFAEQMSRVAGCVDQMLAEGLERPTEFELLTAVAFLHFAKSNCDIVVLETGLGGRLDSTNVIENPLAVIITALGYDHMDRLGATMAEIAAEKGGVIKSDAPVFLYNPFDLDLTGDQAQTALSIISDQCKRQGADLHLVSAEDVMLESFGWDGQRFREADSGKVYQTVLLGLFQPVNAMLAASACQSTGLVDDASVREGIRLARWPGRLELMRRHPPLILDGAHNPQSCRALSQALGRLVQGQPVVYLAGMLADKDYPAMLSQVLFNPSCPAVGFVSVAPDSPRALSAELLAETVRDLAGQLHKPHESGYNVLDAIFSAESIADGVNLALDLANQANVPLCIFGSLYMIGEARKILLTQEDRLWIGTS